jgi:putative hydrolase of the HAD superfamily
MAIDNNIKHILFDLGGVLLNIDPGLTLKVLADMGVQNTEQLHEKLSESGLYSRFDSGKCSEDCFRDEIRQACGMSLTDEQVDEAWNALLLDFPAERVAMMHAIMPNYRLFLLSNTNSIHYRSYTQRFREIHGEEMPSLFDRLFLSYELGAHKPDPEIYRKVIDTKAFNPAETLFIDDSLANIRAAVAEGFIGYHLKEGRQVTDLFQNGKLRGGAEFLNA